MSIEINKVGNGYNRILLELVCNKGDEHPNNTTNKISHHITSGSTLMEIGDDGELEIYFFNEELDKFILP